MENGMQCARARSRPEYISLRPLSAGYTTPNTPPNNNNIITTTATTTQKSVNERDVVERDDVAGLAADQIGGGGVHHQCLVCAIEGQQDAHGRADVAEVVAGVRDLRVQQTWPEVVAVRVKAVGWRGRPPGVAHRQVER